MLSHLNGTKNWSMGLTKGFVRVFPQGIMETPKWILRPSQYSVRNRVSSLFDLPVVPRQWFSTCAPRRPAALASPRRRQWHPTPVLLPGKSHGRRSLVGCRLWGCSELDTTERLHFHFSLSCIGEGNGNPLQCSCLENPRDGGAWWAAVYGVAQSRTRLMRLSSSSSRNLLEMLFSRTHLLTMPPPPPAVSDWS